MFFTKDRTYAYQLLRNQIGFLVNKKDKILHECRNKEFKLEIQHAVEVLELTTTNFKNSHLSYLNHSILHQQLDNVYLAYNRVQELVESSPDYDSDKDIKFHLGQISDLLCLIAYQQCSEDLEIHMFREIQDTLVLV